MQNHWTDEKLIEEIRKGGYSLNQAMKYIYHDSSYKLSVQTMVFQYNGNKEDAEDVFQDGIKHLILNLRANSFAGGSSLKTYFLSICRNIWITQFKRRSKYSKIQNELKQVGQEIKSDHHIKLFEQKEELDLLMSKMPEKCKKVLAYWSLGYSFSEMTKFISDSETALRKRKYDCLKKLMSLNLVNKNEIDN